jgi:hypothetical protein
MTAIEGLKSSVSSDVLERFPNGLNSPIPDQLQAVIDTLLSFHPATAVDEIVKAYLTIFIERRRESQESST